MKEFKNNILEVYNKFHEETFDTIFRPGNIVEYNPLTFKDDKPFVPIFIFRINFKYTECDDSTYGLRNKFIFDVEHMADFLDINEGCVARNKFKIVHNLNDDGSGTCDYDYWQKITINRLVFRRKDEKYKRIFTITEADIVNWMIQDEQERDVQIKSNIVIDPELMNMYWDPVTHEIKDEGVHILPSVWIQEYELIKN